MADRPRSFTPWLIGFLLVLPFGVAVLLVAVFSLAVCPQPIHSGQVWTSWGSYRCFRCRDTGRITLLDQWREGYSEEPWEGMTVSKVSISGFAKLSRPHVLDIAGIRPGMRMTHRLKQEAFHQLSGAGDYVSLDLVVLLDPTTPGNVEVRIEVQER